MENDPSIEQEGRRTHQRLDKIAELLERSGIELDSIQRDTRVNVYQGYMNNADGEFETTDLYSASYIPKANLDDFISQADPVEIHPLEVETRGDDGYERNLILPDMQVAFRNIDGEMQPTHSPEAINVALQIIQDYQPDRVILNGDNLDFPTLGRFQQEPTFHGTFRHTVNYMHQVLAQIRANAPHARIVYIAGNHEQRMEKYISAKAPELGEIYQAGSEKKLHSIPFILNLDAIGNIEYIPGYPAGKYWLSDDIRAIHGQRVGAGSGASVTKVIKDDNNSATFGHVHRIEMAFRTLTEHKAKEDIGRVIVAASFGCLARITGEVPSYHSGTDDEGTPVREIENWQNGIGQIEIEKSTGRLALINAIFMDTFHPEEPYKTRFGNAVYVPN